MPVSDVTKVKDSKLVAEFRAFIVRGNVVDLAVGIIIGLAFGAVVTSLVNDVVMPPIGMALGGADFKESYVLLKEGTPPGPYPSVAAATTAGAVTLRYGVFVNSLINFLIVAFTVFMLVKAVIRMSKKEKARKAEAASVERLCPECFMGIPLEAHRCGHCSTDLRGRAPA